MFAYLVPWLIFLVAMALAAVHDATSLRIPNLIPISLLVGFLMGVSLVTPSLNVVLNQISVGLSLFVLSFALFALRVIGGGDGKLLAAGGLWFTWGAPVFTYLFYVTVTGGLMCLIIYLFRNNPIPLQLHKVDWIDRLHQKNEGIPYGIAIAIGGLLAYPASPFSMS